MLASLKHYLFAPTTAALHICTQTLDLAKYVLLVVKVDWSGVALHPHEQAVCVRVSYAQP